MYALVDCNNFFVSCERVFNSRLEGKPVIVLSNNDGCAIARSNEAKALGIKMGANYFEIENLCRQHNVQVFSTNFVLYADMSNRVKGLLAKFCQEIEDYSIDEAFLDFHGFEMFDLKTYCQNIVKTVTQGTGIPISIGIAPTKTLAKVANRFAKKHAGYKSVCIINTEEKRIKALQKTEIGDVWGIGRKHSKRLVEKNIRTAYDFTQLPQCWVRKHMTVVGERTYKELLGVPCINIESIAPDKKSIMVSRSFGKIITEYSVIAEALSNYTSMAAAKLRNQHSVCKQLMVFITTNTFRQDLPQYSKSIVVTLPTQTNATNEILKHALQGLESIFLPNYQYKKAGVMLFDISPNTNIQYALFDKVDREKQKNLMCVLDNINQRYGRHSLKFAIQGNGESYKIKQERLSPAYTTRLSDLPTVKI